MKEKTFTLPDLAKKWTNLLGYQPQNCPPEGGSFSFRIPADQMKIKLADRKPDDVNAVIKQRVDSLAEMIRQRLAKAAPIGKAHYVEPYFFNGNAWRAQMEDMKQVLGFTKELYLHVDIWAIMPSNWLIGKEPLIGNMGTNSANLAVFAFADDVAKNGFIAAR